MATKISGTNTAANPGITGDDTDTGLFYGTNEIGFSTGGTSRATIKSDGKVGIGTTSPASLLDIVNTGGAAEIICSSSTQPRLILKTSGTTAECRVDFGDSGDSSRGAIGYNHSDDALKFYTTGVANERMRIDSSGRFLKGVNSSEGSRSNTSVRQPHFQLSSPWSSGLGSTSITCTDDYPIIFINSNATYQDNAGAGVLTFSVKDGAGNYCNTASIRSQIDGTPGNNDSPGELSFRVTPDNSCNPTERMKIHSNGNVEINDGNLIIGTAGHGIDFSATSGTGTSELLSDYEEGTWTPYLAKSGDAGVVSSLTDAVGRYVKIGKLLWISFYVHKSSGSFGSLSGHWYVGGVPFGLEIGGTSAYQSILAGYVYINGSHINQGEHNSRWQSNNTNGNASITLYGAGYNTNWSSGAIEMSGHGVFEVD